MSCEDCGREPQDQVQTHYLGCAAATQAAPQNEGAPPEKCEHESCTKPRKAWSGKGAKPKFCADGHTTIKRSKR